MRAAHCYACTRCENGEPVNTEKIEAKPCEHGIAAWLADCKPCRVEAFSPRALAFLDTVDRAYPDVWVIDRPRGRYALIIDDFGILRRVAGDWDGASLRQLHARGVVEWGPRVDLRSAPVHLTEHNDDRSAAELVDLTPAGRFVLGKLSA